MSRINSVGYVIKSLTARIILPARVGISVRVGFDSRQAEKLNLNVKNNS
jgi:hypothetical protein